MGAATGDRDAPCRAKAARVIALGESHGLVLLPLLSLASPPSGRPEWVEDIAEIIGIACLVLGLVGRGWASVYIAGRKAEELVVAGPFSVVRNPLYVFSFIGIVGIGVISEMATLLVAIVVVFALSFHFAVGREEALLARLHGEHFARYARSVPRWIPRFSAWRDTPRLEVEPRLIAVHFRDSSLFFLAFAYFEVCHILRSLDVLPSPIHIP